MHMTRLLRLLFPRTCRRIESEGWYAGRKYEINRRNQKHPRESDGMFKKK